MKLFSKLSENLTLSFSILFLFSSTASFADHLICGSDDTVERSVKNRSCDTVNYSIIAPCNLPRATMVIKCGLEMPNTIPAKLQNAENTCQDRCSDHAAHSTAEAFKFECRKRPHDECRIPCVPSSSSQDETCNVTITREVDDGTPRPDGRCKYECVNRFRWDFFASIVRACSDCVPN